MPFLRFNKKTIDDLPLTQSGQVLYRDLETPGLGLRVGRRRKTFFVEGQIRRRTTRITLGQYGQLDVAMARKRAMAHLVEMGLGRYPGRIITGETAESLTVAEAYSHFLSARPNLSPKTLPNYERTFSLYLRDWSDLLLRDINRQMIAHRHRSLCNGNGPVTANNVMRVFRAVYNVASATYEDLPPNPVKVLTASRSWSPEKRRSTMIPQHRLPAWWAAVHAQDSLARDYLLVVLLTGMRRSEVSGLRWADVDFAGRTLTVPRTKNGDPLILPMSSLLRDLLAARRAVAGEAAKFVFPSASKSGHLAEPKTLVARVVAQSGVAFTIHDLRRTFATIAESLDIPAYALKRLLNHRVQDDVTSGYIVMDVERLRLPVERIANRILELADAKPSRDGQRRNAA